jgi:uncharacterized protein involved in exopolysaccharide biosynthesis
VRETDTQLQTETESSIAYGIAERTDANDGTRTNAWHNVWLAWERRRFLGRCAGIGCLVSLIIAFALPREYEAMTRLMPPDSSENSMMDMLSSKASELGDNPMIGKYAGELLGVKTPGALFVGVLRSRTVADRIIDKFDLRREYWVRRYSAARKKLEDKTEIAEDKKSGIITLKVIDKSPDRAAAMAQEYVFQLNILMAQLTTSKAHRERVFLEDRLRLAKQELDSAAKDLGEFSSKNATLDVEDEGKAIVEAAAGLQGELIAAQSEVKGLEQIYTPDNVRVKSVHAKIAELERKLNEVGGTKGVSTSSSGEGTGADPKNDFLYPSLRQMPILGVRYGDLRLRAKITAKVFEVLTEEYEVARVDEAKEIPSVRALDVALPPDRRAWPPRAIIVVAGTLLAMVAGFFWIVGRQRWENLDPADHKKAFASEVVRVAGREMASWKWVARLRERKTTKWPPASGG